MKTKDLIIQEPHKKSNKGILIALAYVIVVSLSIYAAVYIAPKPNIEASVIYLYIVWGLGFLFLFTFQYVIRHRVKLNVKQRKMRHIYILSILKFKRKWKNLKHLQYISVFKKNNNTYELNLWDDSNSISNVVTLRDYQDAFKKAFFIAEELNIDVLDATDKGNFKLIDKGNFKNAEISLTL